jgi:hypothetical protein
MFSGIEHPTPKATLTGHKSEVTSVSVLAELGMVISGSQGSYFNSVERSCSFVCSCKA